MLAVEMGFAASKSLLEHAINLDLPQPVRLYWVSAREEQRYLENFCRAWDTALDDYAYTPITLTKTEQGMYDAAQIVEQISQAWPRLSESDVYISASIRQSNRLVDALIDAGVDAARITRRQNRELPRQ